MQCELDIYHDKPGERYCYTKSGASNKCVIFIPGLTDGLFAVKYLKELQAKLDKSGWSLIQFIYASSYNGYGLSSIDNDIKHMKLLIDHLVKKYNADSFIFLGFSTGCQDSVYFMKMMDKKYKSMIKGIIFHGPVSDREYEMTLDDYKENMDVARKLVQDSNDEMVLMPLGKSSEHKIAMSAQRYLSLNSRMSKEDMFSSDLTDKELYQQLGHLKDVPMLIVMCGDDEYVPKEVDKQRLLQRMCKAIGNDSKKDDDYGDMIKSCIIDKADHYLSDKECYQQFIVLCNDFVQTVSPSNVDAKL